ANSVPTDHEASICCWNRRLRRVDAPRRLGPPYAPSAAIRIQRRHLAPDFRDEPGADRCGHGLPDWSVSHGLQGPCATEVLCSRSIPGWAPRRSTRRIRWLWDLHSLANTAGARVRLVRPGHSQGPYRWHDTRCAYPTRTAMTNQSPGVRSTAP